jgi:amidase
MKLIARLDKRKSGMDAFEPFTWELADHSRHRTAAGLEAAKVHLQQVSHQLAQFLSEHDLLLTPVLGEPPFRLGQIDQEAKWDDMVEQLFDYVAFTPVANFSGMPAMSVPTYWSNDGLPIGTQFMGRSASEEMLLALAGQLERALQWSQRRPTVWAGKTVRA